MIWNRIRSWLGSTQEDAARAEALNALLTELGYPARETLDDYSARLLRSNTREPFKRLADRGWLLRFNPNRDCETEKVNARLIHLVCERAGVEVGQVRETWFNGGLLGVKIRQRGGRTVVARYLPDGVSTQAPRGVDTIFVLSVAQRLAHYGRSDFTFINIAAPQDAAIVAAIPRSALPQIRKLRLLPILPVHSWAPIFHVTYADELLATTGLGLSDGPISAVKNEELKALSQLGCLVGELRLKNSMLVTTLKPLRNLTAAGALSIECCGALKTLNGLENLGMLGGPLRIRANPLLRDLGALATLRTVYGDVVVDGNAQLSSLTGLQQCQTIFGNLVITDNASLSSLNGLSALTAINGDLVISGNRRLASLEGLKALQDIGGDVTLSNNSQLAHESVVALKQRVSTRGFSGSFDADDPDLLL